MESTSHFGQDTRKITATINKISNPPQPQTSPSLAGSNRRGTACDAAGHRPALRSGRWSSPYRVLRTRLLWPNLLPILQCHPSWAVIHPDPCDSSWVECQRSGMLWRTVHLFSWTRWRADRSVADFLYFATLRLTNTRWRRQASIPSDFRPFGIQWGSNGVIKRLCFRRN